jgi:hypothetical protein
MFIRQNDRSSALNLSHIQNTAVDGVEAGCSVIAMPVEIFLRPRFSTRVYTIPVFAFASMMMIGLPIMSAIFDDLMQMIPFTHPTQTVGLFDIGSLSKLFFIALIVHGVRLYRRILNVNLEKHSRFEGDALPFFALVPGSSSWWRVRTVIEPAFVFLLSIVLKDFFLISTGLSIYLRCAALALCLKSCVSFLRSWETIRDLIDIGNAAPVLAKLVENTASSEDLAPLHLASFPQDLPESIRSQAAVNIASAYNPNR